MGKLWTFKLSCCGVVVRKILSKVSFYHCESRSFIYIIKSFLATCVMWRVYKCSKVSEIVVLGVFWAHLRGGVFQSIFIRFFKNSNDFGKWTQLSTIWHQFLCFWWNSKFKVFGGRNSDHHISVKMKIWGSNKDQPNKCLEKFF